MDRTSSNASDVFSSYLSPLSSKGEPSKDDKKCSLPPTLPKKQLHRIDEHSSMSSLKGTDDNGVNVNVSGDRKDRLDIPTTDGGIDECSSTFDPRKFNASYNETMKAPHYKEIHAKTNHVANGLKVDANYGIQQSPPSAAGENRPNLVINGSSKSSVRNRSNRVSSIRDLVDIRNRIKTQTTQPNSVTSERYVYLDRGNTWCLRISFLICIICIIILFIIVSHITSRLTSLEGT